MIRSFAAFVAAPIAVWLALAVSAASARAAEGPTVPIVYTALARGFFFPSGSFNEINPIFDPKEQDDVRSEGLHLDPGVLHRDKWYLWSPDKPVTAKGAAAWFAGEGIAIEAAGRTVPLLASDWAYSFEQPSDRQPWLVGWLLERGLRHRNGRVRMPDVRRGEGTLFRVRTPGGDVLQLFSVDGSLPPAPLLKDALAWQWTYGGRLAVKRGNRRESFNLLSRPFGASYLHAMAGELRTKHLALRVDAGNILPDVTEEAEAASIGDTMAELKKARLDALVPYSNELRLPRALQASLSATVPLVAANLSAPPGVDLKPYVMRTVAGVRVGIIGLADTTILRQRGLVGGASGWEVHDDVKALRRCLDDIAAESPDTIVVVTNIWAERLPSVLDAADGVAAVLTAFNPRSDWFWTEHFAPEQPERNRYPRPWITAGADQVSVGLLELHFKAGEASRPTLVSADNSLRTATAQEAVPADNAPSWRHFERFLDYVARHSEAVLPDARRVVVGERKLASEDGETLISYRERQWSALAAGTARRAARAEIAVTPLLYGGFNTIGDIPEVVVARWIPGAENLAVLTLSGGRLKRLLAFDTDRSRFALAGMDPDRRLVGGRPLADDEVYKVVTTASIADSDDYRGVFGGDVTTALRLEGERLVDGEPTDRVSLRDNTIAQLKALKGATGGFSPEYKTRLLDLLGDDGHTFEPRVTFQAKPFGLTYQQFQVSNRAPFSEVRNSRINTPDNTTYGGKGLVSLTLDTADLAWENKLKTSYLMTRIDLPTRSLEQKQADNNELSTEFRLKSLKLQTPGSTWQLIPLINANYTFEYSPTVDQQSGALNPRRQEVGTMAGLVLYPATWIQELRIGAITRTDLVVPAAGFKPGFQVGWTLAHALGPVRLALQADLKNYFLTPTDTPDELGLLGDFRPGLEIPLAGGLALELGVDWFLFAGKVPANQSFGSSVTPRVGLSYNATWKPLAGVVY